jgi:hypothetical protein
MRCRLNICIAYILTCMIFIISTLCLRRRGRSVLHPCMCMCGCNLHSIAYDSYVRTVIAVCINLFYVLHVSSTWMYVLQAYVCCTRVHFIRIVHGRGTNGCTSGGCIFRRDNGCAQVLCPYCMNRMRTYRMCRHALYCTSLHVRTYVRLYRGCLVTYVPQATCCGVCYVTHVSGPQLHRRLRNVSRTRSHVLRCTHPSERAYSICASVVVKHYVMHVSISRTIPSHIHFVRILCVLAKPYANLRTCMQACIYFMWL